MSRGRRRTAIGLILLVAGRAVLQLLLYRAGFVSLTADEFGRVLLAARWAQGPHAVWSGVWLPFHMYLFGAALRLGWELIVVPRILVFLMGGVSIVLLYVLTGRLMGSRRAGWISAILLATNPLHIWLSSTPLTAMPNVMFSLAATLSLLLYLKRRRPSRIYWGAWMLALANGFRFEAWLLSLVFSVALVVDGVVLYRRRELVPRQAFHLLLGALIPWLFPVAWLAGNYVETGDPLAFLKAIQAYKLTWYGQSRSWRNPLNTLLKIDPYATILALWAFAACLLGNRRSRAVRWYVGMAVVLFAVFELLRRGQLEPQGNYYRYLAFYAFLAYPAVAYMIDRAVEFSARSQTFQAIVLLLLLGTMGTTQVGAAFRFVNDPAAEGLRVGQTIRALRSKDPSAEPRPVLIELSYWQYLAVHVGANDISRIIYDRELDIAWRQSPSLLLTDVEAFRHCLSQFDVGYVVFRSPELRQAVEGHLNVGPMTEVNGYAFYPVPERLREEPASGESRCPLAFGTGY